MLTRSSCVQHALHDKVHLIPRNVAFNNADNSQSSYNDDDDLGFKYENHDLFDDNVEETLYDNDDNAEDLKYDAETRSLRVQQ